MGNKHITKQTINLRRAIGRVSLFLIPLFLSCESFTEVPLSDSELAGTTIFEDALTSEAALVNIYANIRESGFISGKQSGIGVLMGHYADELDYYGPVEQSGEDFYYNNILPTNREIENMWDMAYKEIYAANSLIERLEISDRIAQDTRFQLQGEALFLRALIHFYLVNLFDAVPYIRATDYRENIKVTKKDPEEIYKLIIADLKKSKSIIGTAYPTQDRTRANKAVVSAFLSRVYLFNKQWQNAIDQASSVIGDSNYTWEDDLRRIFLMDSGTSIWQLCPQNPGQNAEEGRTYFFDAASIPNQSLSPLLFEKFSAHDLRAGYWIEEISNAGNIYYRPTKYRQSKVSDVSLEYSVILRMAEQYLIRAEAYANLGDMDAAIKDLNMIRHRAGLSDIGFPTKEALIDSILVERSRELFTEQGHRWFDLKRTGRAGEVLSILKPGWDSMDTILPLPESELLINPSLKPQNPGY